MESRLSLDKVDKIKLLLNTFIERQKVTLNERQSLIGTLNFACRVVSHGRPFRCRLLDLTRGLQKPHHQLRLTQSAKAGFSAWKLFIDCFNGIYMFSSMIWGNSEQCSFYTDASVWDLERFSERNGFRKSGPPHRGCQQPMSCASA